MRSAIDDETVGIRLHEVNRQRAVDRAIERLRHGLRADWHYLTAEDHDNLRWIIGELWSTSSREAWDGFHFSKLDFDQTRSLIRASARLRTRHTSGIGSLQPVADLLREASGRFDHERTGYIARVWVS